MSSQRNIHLRRLRSIVLLLAVLFANLNPRPVQAAGSDDYLASFAITPGDFIPALGTQPGNYDYSNQVMNSTQFVDLAGQTMDPGADVVINNVPMVLDGSGIFSWPSFELIEGTTMIVMEVTPSVGATRRYGFHIRRDLEFMDSNNATLQDLSVSSGALLTTGAPQNPYFVPNSTDYTNLMAISHSFDPNLSVMAVPTDPNDTVTVTANGVALASPADPFTLTEGTNYIEVRVHDDAMIEDFSYGIVYNYYPAATYSVSGTVTDAAGDPLPGVTISDADGFYGFATSQADGTFTLSGLPSRTAPSPAYRLVPSLGGSTFSPSFREVFINDANVTGVDFSVNDPTALANLGISSGTLNPDFTPATTDYTVSLANSVSSVTVTPTLNDLTSTVTVNGVTLASGGTSDPIALAVGQTTITVVVTAADTVTTKTYTVSVTRAGSSNADLSGLILSSGELAPTFNPATTTYTASVANGVNALTVAPTTSDSNASVTVNGVSVDSGQASGSIPLSVGSNVITVRVTAQDAVTTQTYQVTVTRAASANANLSSLTLSSGALSPVFNSGVTTYIASVANNVAALTVTPTLADATATVTVGGTPVNSGEPSAEIPLTVGDNSISVMVTAQDGVTNKTYNLTVSRAAANDANLSGLSLSSGTLTPAFSAAVTSYTASVANGVTSLTVTPTKSDPAATVTVNSGSPANPVSLSVGDNEITILVTAQDSSTKTYTLTVTRAASNNANLSALSLSGVGLSPAFSPEVTSYTALAPFVTTSVTVSVTPADSTANVTVNGASPATPVNLNVGPNVITVLVTAQDSSTKTYTITITRAALNDATLSDLSVSPGSLFPEFYSGLTSYWFNVGNGVSSLTVTPTLHDPNASVTVNGVAVVSGQPSTPIALNLGANTITVHVTAQNGYTTKNYILTVTRLSPGLSNLTLSEYGLEPAFSTTDVEYFINMGAAPQDFTITPTAMSSDATITIEGESVASGQSYPVSIQNLIAGYVTIRVTESDEVTFQDYTINLYTEPLVLGGAETPGNLKFEIQPFGQIGVYQYDGSSTWQEQIASGEYKGSLLTTDTDSYLFGLLGFDADPLPVVISSELVDARTARTVWSTGSVQITQTVSYTNGDSYAQYRWEIKNIGSAPLANLTYYHGEDTYLGGSTTGAGFWIDSIDAIGVSKTESGNELRMYLQGITLPNGHDSLGLGAITANVAGGELSNAVDPNLAADNGYALSWQKGELVPGATWTIRAAERWVSRPASGTQVTAPIRTDSLAGREYDLTYTVTNTTGSPVDLTLAVEQSQLTWSAAIQGESQVTVPGDSSVNVIVRVRPPNNAPDGAQNNIALKAHDGSVETSDTSVMFASAPSADARLSSLLTSSGNLSPAFSAGTTAYTLVLPNGMEQASFIPTVQSAGATVTVNGAAVPSGDASAPINLAGPGNPVEIVVTAQDGVTTQTYTVTMTHQVPVYLPLVLR